MSSTPGTELRRRSLGAAVSFIGFMLSPMRLVTLYRDERGKVAYLEETN